MGKVQADLANAKSSKLPPKYFKLVNIDNPLAPKI